MVRLGSKGFSLLEVMIAGGVLMILSYATLQLFEAQTKITATGDAQFELVDMQNQVRNALSIEEACSRAFKGKPLSGATTNKLYRAYRPTALDPYAFSDLFEVDKQYGKKLTIKSIQLKYVGPASPAPFNGEGLLTMEISRGSGVLGGEKVTRTIPMRVSQDTVDPTLILSCSFQGGEPPNPQDVCDVVNGVYDPATQKCDVLANIPGPTLYKNMVTGALQLEPSRAERFTCSECRNDCNPCPSGYTMGTRSCSLGKNCGLHKFRNCTAWCTAPSTVVGKIIGPDAVPSPAPTPIYTIPSPPVYPGCPLTPADWWNSLTSTQKDAYLISIGNDYTELSVFLNTPC